MFKKRSNTMKHKQVMIKHGDLEAKVDEKIADLILNLWKMDIITILSCQNNVPKNYVWIEFFSAEDAERFLNIVAEYDEDMDSIYQNIVGRWSDLKHEWIYDVHPVDFGVTYDYDKNNKFVEKTFDGNHAFQFNIAIRFPNKHLQFVKDKVEKAVPNYLHNCMLDAVNGMISEIVQTEKMKKGASGNK